MTTTKGKKVKSREKLDQRSMSKAPLEQKTKADKRDSDFTPDAEEADQKGSTVEDLQQQKKDNKEEADFTPKTIFGDVAL